jgi:hypothetical protein
VSDPRLTASLLDAWRTADRASEAARAAASQAAEAAAAAQAATEQASLAAQAAQAAAVAAKAVSDAASSMLVSRDDEAARAKAAYLERQQCQLAEADATR